MNTSPMRIKVLTDKLTAKVNEWYDFMIMYHCNSIALRMAISHVFPQADDIEQREIKKEFEGGLWKQKNWMKD